MKIKNGEEEAYKRYKESNNEDPYSARIVSFGEEWARLMEAEMGSGKELTSEMMDRCAGQADTDGITGFMYGAAASALSHFWEHAEKFQVAFNTQYMPKEKAEELAKTRPGATVNPAIITIGE